MLNTVKSRFSSGNKSKKLCIGFTIYTLLIIVFALFSFIGCSENDIMGPVSGNLNSHGDMPDTGVTITLTKDGYGFFHLRVTNNTSDTINDFHIQMVDTNVRILSPNTMNSGWIKTYGGNNNSDSSKVCEETRRGTLSYNPIKPGQTKEILGFYLGFRNSPTKNAAFDWQATKDGVIYRSGRYQQ